VLGPWIVVVGVFACLLAALWLLGNLGGDNGSNSAEQTATPTPAKTAKPKSKKKEKGKASAPKTVRFQIMATGPVWVCLEDGAGKPLVDQRTLQAGEKTKTFRGKHFVVAFGNGSARMRINGRTVTIPSRSDAIGYDLRVGRKPRELPSGQRPTCT
jgi:hypothetical protein